MLCFQELLAPVFIGLEGYILLKKAENARNRVFSSRAGGTSVERLQFK